MKEYPDIFCIKINANDNYCLISNKTMSPHLSNMKRHFVKYHFEIILQTRQEKETLYKSLAKIFFAAIRSHESSSKKIPFAVSFTLAKSLKPFSDGE
ncbi:hypothetical protein A3Q56_07421, partial [Intoshia linei]